MSARSRVPGPAEITTDNLTTSSDLIGSFIMNRCRIRPLTPSDRSELASTKQLSGQTIKRRVALNTNAKTGHQASRYAWPTICAGAILLGLSVSTPSLAQQLPASNTGQAQAADMKSKATELLRQSRMAMNGGNLELAERYIGQAESIAKQAGIKYNGILNRFSDSPARARRDLAKLRGPQLNSPQQSIQQQSIQQQSIQQQGIQQQANRQQLAQQPNRLPIEAAQAAATLPTNQASQQRQLQARSMMAQARAAFDRGDLNLSESLVRQAQALKVPQQSFAGGDSPWELGLKINKQRQLTGLGPAANQGVVPANATQGANTPNVAPAIYDPSTDRTFVRTAAAEEAVPNNLTNAVSNSIPDPNMLAQQLNGLNPLTQQPPPVSLQGNPTETINQLLQGGTSTPGTAGIPGTNFAPAQVAPPATLQTTPPATLQTAPVQLFTPSPDPTGVSPVSPAPAGTYQDFQQTTQPTPYTTEGVPSQAPGGTYDDSPQQTYESFPVPSSNTEYTTPAEELIRMGDQALQDKQLDTARDYFRQAWAMKDSLDATTRQRLQDHLLLAGSSNSKSDEDDEETEAEREERARINRFVLDVQREQATIARDVRTKPKDAWDAMKELREQVQDYDLPPEVRRPLASRLDEAVREMEAFIESNRAQIELDEQNRAVLATVNRERKMRVEIENKLAVMVDDFNGLMDQQRYSEAYVLAKQAREMSPHTEVTEAMVWKSRFADRIHVENMLRDRNQRSFEYGLEGGTLDAPLDDYRTPIAFPKKWDELIKRRDGLLSDRDSRYTEEEQAIQRALRKKVPVQFDGAPLSEVIDTLGRLTGVNMFIDVEGLSAEGVSSDTPVTMNLSQEISLKSVLNLVLGQHRLGYTIQDEVLRITSEQASAGDVFRKVYYVGDLVIPIPNFVPGYNSGMAGALAQAHAALGYGPGGWAQNRNGGRTPLIVANNQQGEAQNTSSGLQHGLAQLNGGTSLTSLPGMPGAPAPPPASGLGGAAGADFQSLINLITSTVSPNSWDEVGGPGAVESFNGNLSLVISNTQEVHDQIADLLDQLRREQDLQVTIEVRFVTLQDNFFERIGVDFDFDVRDGSGLVPGDLLGSDDNPNSDEALDVTIGLDPQGNPTLDLDLAFSQNTFASAIPAFGGFDPNSAASFGFAILSDIEAFFVIEAIQGDTRTNVMQAPKLTMFNGQFANITDQSQQPFVTSVVPVVGDFAVAQQPIILVLAEGTQLNVQAVVSSDRRFVRLTMLPQFSQIGDVDTFTFEGETSSDTGTISTTDPDTGETTTNNAVTFTSGTTVQLPNFAVTSVSTTVSVPDGGTVLMGGIKRLAEGRNEQGMPILSKLPYVNRLFKNVGIGRETQTLMMMVTPRIIIQEEEEERILGTSLP